MKRLLVALTLAVTSLALPARAQTERVEALASAGAGFRKTTAIDLAQEAGASGYGSGNDVSPGALGFELRGGVLLPMSLELDVTGVAAVGGLALGNVEQRYFGGIGTFGSSASVGLDGSIRYAPRISPDVRLLAGPAIGWQRLVASSEMGRAWIDLLGIGLDLGTRIRLNTISRVVDGHLEVVLRARREIPLEARVQHGSGDVLFSGAGGGSPIYGIGIGVGYVFAFHAKAEPEIE